MIKRSSIPESVTGLPQGKRHNAVKPGAKLTDGNQKATKEVPLGKSALKKSGKKA